jgi:hypothetical protein
MYIWFFSGQKNFQKESKKQRYVVGPMCGIIFFRRKEILVKVGGKLGVCPNITFQECHLAQAVLPLFFYGFPSLEFACV